MTNISIFGDARSNYIEASYNHGATPDKVLYIGELESSHYHWIFPVGSGGYGGITWDHRGVSTPVMIYLPININLHSVANIRYNGNAHADLIESFNKHSVTPPAFGWVYQGIPAGFGHIAIVFSWGESSASSQSVSHPNGITPSRSNITNRGSTHICRIMESGIPGSIETAVIYGNYSWSLCIWEYFRTSNLYHYQ